MSASRRVLFVSSLCILLPTIIGGSTPLTTGCGGRNRDPNLLGGGAAAIINAIGGLLNVENFTIPAGETRTATSDLTVRASQNITIDGTLLINPGVVVALLADGIVTIRGRVETIQQQAAPSRTLPENARRQDSGGQGGAFFSSGSDVILESTATIQTPGFGAATHAGDGRIVIAGTVNRVPAGFGEDGSPAQDGADAANIELGTDAAIQSFMQGYNVQAFRPTSVRISGTIIASDGQFGGDDGTGHGANPKVGQGGNGGDGGDINIAASQLIDVTGANLQAGFGGPGGTVTVNGSDGSAAAQAGESVHATSGNGGDGGSITFSAPTVAGRTGTAGSSGFAGRVVAEPGNGGPGGRGGNATIVIGKPGRSGTAPQPPAEPPIGALIILGKGIGGNSTDSSTNGGRAGDTTITQSDGVIPQISEMRVSGFKGGDGFNGCAATPIMRGTNGGDGGNITASGSGVTPQIDATALDGGRGGDGNPPGRGGAFGDVNDRFFGDEGEPGGPCTATQAALLLDQNLGSFRAGEQIVMTRITGGNISNGDVGCPEPHLHGGGGGITIDGQGPFPDPNPSGCGYGRIVQVARQRKLQPTRR